LNAGLTLDDEIWIIRRKGFLMVKTVYLGFGSNVSVETNIQAGITALRSTFGDIGISPVYRSVAVGFTGNDFINLAVSIETSMQPLELKEYLNQLEDDHDRQRDVPKFSDRTLDIDILLFGDLYLHLPSLILPREEILKYAHVLKPLADLAPDLIHPVTHQSMMTHWQNFEGERTGLKQVDFPL
jgi:2-amino-4-hydroxy-6-hydroxymethyldihydropteridine diphosphokinase